MGRTRVWIPEIPEPSPIVSTPTFVTELSGHFYVEVVDAATGDIKKTLEFPNCLTNGLLDVVAGGLTLDQAFQWMELGTGGVTGVNAPSASNTTLVHPIGVRTTFSEGFIDKSGSVTSSIEGPYLWFKRCRTFLEEQSNGNLTELGFWTENNLTLVNRTAFKDEFGIPTTVTKTINDMLRIWFEFRIYPPMVPLTGSILLGSSSYAYTVKPYTITSEGGWMRLFHRAWGGWQAQSFLFETKSFVDPLTASVDLFAGSVNTTAVLSDYAGGTFYRDMHLTWSNGAANFLTGVQYMIFGVGDTNFFAGSNAYQWQYFFTPKIPKNSSKQLQLSFRWQLRQKDLP